MFFKLEIYNGCSNICSILPSYKAERWLNVSGLSIIKFTIQPEAINAKRIQNVAKNAMIKSIIMYAKKLKVLKVLNAHLINQSVMNIEIVSKVAPIIPTGKLINIYSVALSPDKYCGKAVESASQKQTKLRKKKTRYNFETK